METQAIEELVDLSGKAAVVTGGAMVIGRTIAMALAEAGAAVMIADSNLEAASRTVEQIRLNGGRAEAMYAEASSVDDAQRVCMETVKRFGTIDILVNNTASYGLVPTLPEMQSLLGTMVGSHVRGVLNFSRAAANYMIDGGRGGRIINIAPIDSVQSEPPAPGMPKSRNVATVTKMMADQLGSHRVTVNALAPGLVLYQSAQMQAVGILGVNDRSLDQAVRNSEASPPVGETSRPEDIATVVLFLVSPAGEKVTGNLVVVD